MITHSSHHTESPFGLSFLFFLFLFCGVFVESEAVWFRVPETIWVGVLARAWSFFLGKHLILVVPSSCIEEANFWLYANGDLHLLIWLVFFTFVRISCLTWCYTLFTMIWNLRFDICLEFFIPIGFQRLYSSSTEVFILVVFSATAAHFVYDFNFLII